MRLGDLRQRGLLIFRAAIDAKTGGDRIRCKTRIELAGFAFACKGHAEYQIHMRAVWRFVVGEARVAIDAREIGAAAATTIEIRIEAQNLRGELFAQRAQRLHYGLFVALAVRRHPFRAIVAREIAKETKGLARDR